jgi:CubicO group peptidase (beta-lactamase class C family)
VAEVATGEPWEQLMRERVWEPLAMTHTGVGWPATEARPDQPLGHMGDPPEAQAVGAWQVGAFLAPAGDVHASAADLVRFGLTHAQGLAGVDGLLLPDTVEWLHAVPEGAGRMPYARGWFVTPGGDWHAGSAGSFYALLQIVPEHDAAVAVLANAGDPAIHAGAMKLVARVREALETGG